MACGHMSPMYSQQPMMYGQPSPVFSQQPMMQRPPMYNQHAFFAELKAKGGALQKKRQ